MTDLTSYETEVAKYGLEPLPMGSQEWKDWHNRRAMHKIRKQVELHMQVGVTVRSHAQESRPERTWRWVQEHRVGSLIAGAVGFGTSVVGLIAGIGTIWPW